MAGDIGPVNMTEVVNKVAKRFLPLLGEAFVTIEQGAGSFPSI
jgi:hypothetical protein